MAVSQKQIAERVGVSIALVSRVLSGKAREVGIAETTIKKVIRAAEEMGYVPSAAALTLKGKASRTIGVVVYDFRDPFFGPMIEKLQDCAHEQDYSLVIAGFKGRHPAASDLAPLHKHAIDGLIVLGSSDESEWLNGFSEMSVVRIGHRSADDPGTCISVDEEDAAKQLMGHLISRGWKRGIFIGANLYGHSLRYQALEKTAQELGFELGRHIWAVDGFEAGEQSVKSLGDEMTALICANDPVAMGALRALHDSGRKMPVTGFDDIPAAAQYIPPITTYHQPINEMVRQAFDAVVQKSEPVRKFIKGQLVIRSSS
ncbi:LacI family DNA-binding transcriptional regulator [Pontiella agarivorans]|uniref:LacI family DNA-binding transcriptional regulator n=1 Tax=Pontiella agarivorans TaxID=3038953 RepID=A0ABU5MZR9_9BACT|nr:LacI family DNA-binding transcriptional regulator [Pontiella agarivorans]MDZ8119659.1 LacI family DNA-binding transcriptional regulator [Pontiella agarivorans]